tara:strand:- start:32568 stop:33038 length:471 start_codon:yes stop_codon:yes gene_type:complete
VLIFSSSLHGQVDSLMMDRIPSWVRHVVFESALMENYNLDTSRNPFYLEADFNDDGLMDIAFFVKSKLEGKTGVLIVNKGKNVGYILGAGKDIGIGADVFWCNIWFIYREKYIYNFKDKKKKFAIETPGLELVKDEKTSVVIYWDKKRYKTHIKNL